MLSMGRTTLIKKEVLPGRHIVSLVASRVLERTAVKKILGVNLVAAVFFAGIITPQAQEVIDQLALRNTPQTAQISVNLSTKTTYGLPLTTFSISQFFSFWHPGIDMVAPLGAPIFAIESGTVQAVETSYFGYGKNVFIAHAHHIVSHYAHLSEIKTIVGKKVERGEIIGLVGATGWATGNHLHFEVYQNSIPVNPLDILPITLSEIRLDSSIAASSTAQLITKKSL